MQLAFLINNFYPFGGMEKNFLRIVHACLEHGLNVHIFTMSWQGEQPDGAHVTLVPFSGLSNHGRSVSFVRNFKSLYDPLNFDLVVGFNRMPELDLYYNADVCYVLDMARRRSFLSKLTSRYRVYAQFEAAVFGADSTTHIMYLSEAEKRNYIEVYSTPESRFHYLPPGITKERIRVALTAEIRKQVREEFGVDADAFFLLMIGSDFARKGVARSIKALASLPVELQQKAHLFIIGEGKEARYKRQAGKVGVAKQVHFLGGRLDVPHFLAAADILLHPAVSENTGNVIAEAVVAGCPILATEACGYGFHVEKGNAGRLVGTPFVQEEMNHILAEMLDFDLLARWGKSGFDYADRVDLYSRPEVAVKIIMQQVERKQQELCCG